MSDQSKGVSGDWAEEHKAWLEATEELFAERDSVEIKVLSWGPGESSPAFNKRREICDALKAAPNTHVMTSEELFEAEPRFSEYATFDAEEMQAIEADVIIVLQVDDPKVTGAPAEVVRFEKHPAIGPKLRVVVPRSLKNRGALIYEPTLAIPESQTFSYSKKQYKACEDIRAACRRWVDAVRRDKHLRARRNDSASHSLD